jgi:Rrf2 family protein
MKFSAKFEYALLVLLYLKCEPDEAPTSGRTLSEKLSIPYRFLEQILADLKRAGLVRSIRGYQGGYQLSSDPAKMSIRDIYEATDGKFEPWDCAQAEAQEKCNTSFNQCVIHAFYQDFKLTIDSLMRKYTLDMLCTTAHRMKTEIATAQIEKLKSDLQGELQKQ